MRRQRRSGLVGGRLTVRVGAEGPAAHARRVALYLLPVEQDAAFSYFSGTICLLPHQPLKL